MSVGWGQLEGATRSRRSVSGEFFCVVVLWLHGGAGRAGSAGTSTSQLGVNDAELACADRTGGSGGGSGVGGGGYNEITKGNKRIITFACWWPCAARGQYRAASPSWQTTMKTPMQPGHPPGLCRRTYRSHLGELDHTYTLMC